jgi:hypothetical protein
MNVCGAAVLHTTLYIAWSQTLHLIMPMPIRGYECCGSWMEHERCLRATIVAKGRCRYSQFTAEYRLYRTVRDILVLPSSLNAIFFFRCRCPPPPVRHRCRRSELFNNGFMP